LLATRWKVGLSCPESAPGSRGRSRGTPTLQLAAEPADLILGDDAELRPQERRALEPVAGLDESPVHLDQERARPERQAADLGIADAALVRLRGAGRGVLSLAATD